MREQLVADDVQRSDNAPAEPLARASPIIAEPGQPQEASSRVVLSPRGTVLLCVPDFRDRAQDLDGARYRPSLHPSLQVAGYADYMRDFVSVLAERPDAIAGVAYLHNATDHGVGELRDMPCLLYTSDAADE